MAKKLRLSQEQRDRAREMINEYRRAILDRTLTAKAEGRRNRQQKEQADLLEILISDQRKQWGAIQGAKVDLHILS